MRKKFEEWKTKQELDALERFGDRSLPDKFFADAMESTTEFLPDPDAVREAMANATSAIARVSHDLLARRERDRETTEFLRNALLRRAEETGRPPGFGANLTFVKSQEQAEVLFGVDVAVDLPDVPVSRFECHKCGTVLTVLEQRPGVAITMPAECPRCGVLPATVSALAASSSPAAIGASVTYGPTPPAPTEPGAFVHADQTFGVYWTRGGLREKAHITAPTPEWAVHMAVRRAILETPVDLDLLVVDGQENRTRWVVSPSRTVRQVPPTRWLVRERHPSGLLGPETPVDSAHGDDAIYEYARLHPKCGRELWVRHSEDDRITLFRFNDQLGTRGEWEVVP